MSSWYSAAELAGLPGLPGTVQRVTARAKRDSWPSRTRQARGGGREYPETAIPPVAQAELARRRTDAALVAYESTVSAWLAAVEEGRLLVERDALTAELRRLEQYRGVVSRHIRGINRLLGEGNGDE